MEKRKNKKKKLSFEKTIIVALNNKDMGRIKGGGFPPGEMGSNIPGCDDQNKTGTF